MPYITVESGNLSDAQKEELIKRLTEVSSDERQPVDKVFPCPLAAHSCWTVRRNFRFCHNSIYVSYPFHIGVLFYYFFVGKVELPD